MLVSNSRDFATDYVVAELRRRGVSYHRFDLDLLADDALSLDPVQPVLSIRTEGRSISISPPSASRTSCFALHARVSRSRRP